MAGGHLWQALVQPPRQCQGGWVGGPVPEGRISRLLATHVPVRLHYSYGAHGHASLTPPPPPPSSLLSLPGGDYGKKELSPALSNRFTSIWVPAIEDGAELLAILESRLAGGRREAAARGTSAATC